MQTSAVDPIDTRQHEFLSYAPPMRGHRKGMEESWVSVEPDLGEYLAVEASPFTAVFPLRHSKVQKPLLPPETLRRDRLLDWLDAHIHCRLIYLIAEAGFGKTTLIADYARRSRLRTFWYRLDEDDTDGLAFMRYLVASCQAVDPSLLRRTAALLNEPSIEPLRQEAVVEALFSELEPLGDTPSLLVLDDFHAVDKNNAITAIVERLVERGPERLSVLVASRHTPQLAVAQLRSVGQLAELDRKELRLSLAETGRLLNSYGLTLEADTLSLLHARTDGWAASLALVRAALEGRNAYETRHFVRSLNGAAGALYDYVAEEVIGDLDPSVRDFLLRTSLLEQLDPDSVAAAVRVSPQRAHELLRDAEGAGLLSRCGGFGRAWAAHPLVREFLLNRLETEIGTDAVTELHRCIAASLESQSWRLAARHWAAAGDSMNVQRVICAALPTIVGTGDCCAAEELISSLPAATTNPWFDVIRCRRLAENVQFEKALELARSAILSAGVVAEHDRDLRSAFALTLLHLGIQLNDPDLSHSAARQLMEGSDSELAAIGAAASQVCESSLSGSLDSLCQSLGLAADISHSRGHHRHEGISLLNLSQAETPRANPEAAIRAARVAVQLLEDCGSPVEVSSAQVNVLKGLAYLGEDESWRRDLRSILAADAFASCPEDTAELIELEALYGEPGEAKRLAERRLRAAGDASKPYVAHLLARIALLHGKFDVASATLRSAPHVHIVPGFHASRSSLMLQLRAMSGQGDSALGSDCHDAATAAESQQAWLWGKSMRLTEALVSPGDVLSSTIVDLGRRDAAVLSIQAELVARRLGDLDCPATDLVFDEATRRPDRWRWAVRQHLSADCRDSQCLRRAAGLLEVVGTEEDIRTLRALAKRKPLRLPDAGLCLAKRVAPRAFVEDLGKMSIRIGGRVVEGTDIRRKSLSLLAFLLSRSQLMAAREQVMDALWPEMDPEQASNSLNQTAYFLRRVFEPEYSDDLGGRYLHSSPDLIWLDRDLVASRSNECLGLMSQGGRDLSPELALLLAKTYTGKFAADFPYDEWATTHRNSLHASFIDRMERSISADTKAGAFDRALSVAQLALACDPEAEQIELWLLRLYRLTGATAAAAEQYAHYASVLRDQLGVEPPPLEEI